MQLSKLLFLFTPEETRWPENNRPTQVVVKEKYNMLSCSIKAILWAAVSVICALMIGQLN